MSKRKAVIIGAGIAGIASAIRLALQGYDTAVYEANSYPGGKLCDFRRGGYRFDAGPSLFTMPQYVDELFLLAGRKPADYFRYERLDAICRYFYEDGTRMTAWADADRLADEIAAHTSDAAGSVKRFLRKSSRIYDITHHVFLEKSLHKLSTYLHPQTLKSIARFSQIDPFRNMNQANESYFKDSKTLRFFNRYATYNGSDPYRAPATLNIIPHLEQHFGAYFPEGGMYSIVLALVKLAEELGVVFHYGKYVEEILCEGRRVSGIRVEGENVRSDVVVSNMDVWFTWKKLLKGQPMPRRIQQQERSSSALIFYWGVKGSFPELDLHNIFFSEDYRAEFNAIWKEQSICKDPTVYVNISSKLAPADAPAGCENWFVMINVPSDSGQDWDRLIPEARESVLNKLERVLRADLRQLIEVEDMLDPRSIEAKTSSYQGSLYGTSSNSPLSAFLRYPNFTKNIRGLYFAGGSVHPGGGIPLALLSAKIVAETIAADRARKSG